MRRVKIKFLTALFVLAFLHLSVWAENFPNVQYKNIKNKANISYNSNTDSWTEKANKRDGYYYTKVKGFGDFYDYLYPDGNLAFSTGCEYEFIHNNKFFGYSNKDLKFYEISFFNNNLSKRELNRDEISNLFPNYKIISLSEFSKKTNSIKIKKNFSDLNIILLNDSDKTFENYSYSSGNSKIKTYDLSSFLTVTKPGMIQFSSSDGDRAEKNWYVILVR